MAGLQSKQKHRSDFVNGAKQLYVQDSMLGRSVFALADQAMYSLTSLILAIMVARESSVNAVGAWAIAYGSYSFILSVLRSVINTTTLVQNNPRGDARKNLDGLDEGALSAEILLALIVGIILSVGGLLLPDGDLSNYLVIFGILSPLLFSQDAIRYCLIRHKRMVLVTAIDCIWLITQVGLSVLFILLYSKPELVTIAWGLGSGLSAAVGIAAIRPRLSVRRAIRFFKSNRKFSRTFLLESLMDSGVANGLPAIVGLILGLGQAGAFRGAMTLLGVVGIVIAGLTPLVTVEAVSRLRGGMKPLTIVSAWSALIAAFGVLATALLSVMPDSIGSEMLGETWFGTKEIILVMSLQVIFRGPVSGVPLVLRAMHQFGFLIRLQVVKSVITLALISGGAWFGGIIGVAWAWLLTSMIMSAIALFVLARVTRKLGN